MVCGTSLYSETLNSTKLVHSFTFTFHQGRTTFGSSSCSSLDLLENQACEEKCCKFQTLSDWDGSLLLVLWIKQLLARRWTIDDNLLF